MKSVFDSGSVDSGPSLADLDPGESAVVVAVDGADAIGRRLQDLGFLPSTRVRAIRRAPLGDPSLYELRGYQLCLRQSEARQVRIRRESASAEPAAATGRA